MSVLYPKRERPLDPADFANPGAEYRGAPFWAWNTKLDRARLSRQIDAFKLMGMGGFHMHARTGLATPYLGEEFMANVRACVEKAAREGMLAWLYDEDRWPSGFGGGLVTREERFRAKYLLFTPTPYGAGPQPAPLLSAAVVSRAENGVLLASYDVRLEDGFLRSYRRLNEGEEAEGTPWHAYLETMRPTPWWNGQAYVDTLDPEAIRRFIEVTHERYAAEVGEHFGQTVRTVFTDEPQFPHKGSLKGPDELSDVILPWTADFSQTHKAEHGADPLDTLPELFWELPEGASAHRYRYHDHLAERFASAYADQVGAWCDARGLLLTGHMMEEASLLSQTHALGEAMRPLRAFGLPGVDMLCDQRELTTAKQAQSVARQFGREGVASELYGVTNWDFSFAGHKGQGDWQAALGVTARVHHLAWASMAGEAKRDYPASIFTQSPWWREYSVVEDHFSRLNTVLTRGKPRVRVGVLHPVESYWLAFGPLSQTALEREAREEEFKHLTEWLLFGLIDFDFIAESLLPGLAGAQGGPSFRVGEAAYDAVIVPNLRTVRGTTLERLEHFRAAGGLVVFLGESPSLVDALPDGRARAFAASCPRLPFQREALLAALAPLRDVQAVLAGGRPADALLHQVRDDGAERHVFVCNTDRENARDGVELRFRGEWQVTLRDTLTGAARTLAARVERGWTVLSWDFPAHGHLLVTLSPSTFSAGSAYRRPNFSEVARLADPVPVTLSEPNALLLDLAEYRLDDGAWRAQEEILRLDTTLRRELGWPLRMEALAQPWTDAVSPNPQVSPNLQRALTLRFTLRADVGVRGPRLALEDASSIHIRLDGHSVPTAVTGWWVDEAVETVALPDLAPGAHALELTMPYHPRANPEWVYLLGDFGVEVRGRHARLVAPVRELAWGDWARQGLPFYTGNVTYHAALRGGDGPLTLEVEHFAAPLLRVALDERDLGPIAFAPYRVDLGALASGPHYLDLTAFGHRFNAFGCLHNAQPDLLWVGPNAWRSEGAYWADEYQLRPMGVLVAPRLFRERGTAFKTV